MYCILTKKILKVKTFYLSKVMQIIMCSQRILSSRCQHCRQRCKTSSDLFAHLQSCPEMIKKGSDNSCFNTSQNTSIDPAETNGNEDIPMDEDGEIDDEPEENDEFVESKFHRMHI